MFHLINDCIFSWIENKKLSHIYSEKNIPDIILTNQNTIALGFKYDKNKMNAPTLLIKGRYFYAQKIIEFGKTKNVAVIDEPNLTNNIFSNLKIGTEIPEKYYEPLAKIYSKVLNEEKMLAYNEKYIFNENLLEKRKIEYEVFSLDIPEKIELQLSNNLFLLIGGHLSVNSVLGIKIKSIKITENKNFENEEYCIRINGINICNGKIRYILLSPSQQLSLLLMDIIRKHSQDLLGRDDTLQFISQMKEKYPILVQETMKYFSIGEIRQVLCGLLQEGVTIQNIVNIFETISDFGGKEYNIDLIIEQVRRSIGREICFPYLDDKQILKVIGFEYELEIMIEKNIVSNNNGKVINPKFYEILSNIIVAALENNSEIENKPIFLYNSLNRKTLYEAIKCINHEIVVLSLFEVPKDIKIKYLYQISGTELC